MGDATEALFRLEVVYDYPNISNFSIARKYYLRTIETYPGTESARKAQAAIDWIAAAARDVGAGGHGWRQPGFRKLRAASSFQLRSTMRPWRRQGPPAARLIPAQSSPTSP